MVRSINLEIINNWDAWSFPSRKKSPALEILLLSQVSICFAFFWLDHQMRSDVHVQRRISHAKAISTEIIQGPKVKASSNQE
jgi:hypothetical protein